MNLPKKFLVFVLMSSEIVTGCYQTCCCNVRGLVDCSFNNGSSPPAPGVGSAGWCGGTEWQDDGKSITHINMSHTNTSRVHKDIFKNYPNVQNINLNYCNFTSLEENEFRDSDFNNSSKLGVIQIRNNTIKSIDINAFRGLSNLLKLDLSGNQISDLQPGLFGDLEKLIELRLDRNNISTLDMRVFNGLVSLRHMSLNSNSIKVLHQFPITIMDLTNLDMQHNVISDIDPKAFDNLHHIISLDIGFNQITSLNEDVFKHNPELVRIHLNNNKLSTLPKNVFRHLCELAFLDVSFNQLTTPYYEWFATMVFRIRTSKRDAYYNKRVTDGNKWICNENLSEYKVFLEVVRFTKCENSAQLSHVWFESFNIECESGTNTSNKVISSSCKNLSTSYMDRIPPIPNSTCYPNDTLCYLLAPECVNVPREKLPKSSAIVQTNQSLGRVRNIFIASVVICLALAFLLFVVHRRRKIRKKKRQNSESSYESSLYEPEIDSVRSDDSISGRNSTRQTLHGTQITLVTPSSSCDSESSHCLSDSNASSLDVQFDSQSTTHNVWPSYVAVEPSFIEFVPLSFGQMPSTLNTMTQKACLVAPMPDFISPDHHALLSSTSDLSFAESEFHQSDFSSTYSNGHSQFYPVYLRRNQSETFPKTEDESPQNTRPKEVDNTQRKTKANIYTQTNLLDFENASVLIDDQQYSEDQIAEKANIVCNGMHFQTADCNEEETRVKTHDVGDQGNVQTTGNLYVNTHERNRNNVCEIPIAGKGIISNPPLDPIYTPMRALYPERCQHQCATSNAQHQYCWSNRHFVPLAPPLASPIPLTPLLPFQGLSGHKYCEIPPSNAGTTIPTYLDFSGAEAKYARIWSPRCVKSTHPLRNEYADEIPHALPHPDPASRGVIRYPKNAVGIPEVVYPAENDSSNANDQQNNTYLSQKNKEKKSPKSPDVTHTKTAKKFKKKRKAKTKTVK